MATAGMGGLHHSVPAASRLPDFFLLTQDYRPKSLRPAYYRPVRRTRKNQETLKYILDNVSLVSSIGAMRASEFRDYYVEKPFTTPEDLALLQNKQQTSWGESSVERFGYVPDW